MLKSYWLRHYLRFGPGLIFLLLLLLNVTGHIDLPLLDRLENWTYDLRLNLTIPGTIDNRIVIVDIDEKSLAEEGQWPWGRDRMALLVSRLFDRYQAAVVGFDVVFAEEDARSGLRHLEHLAAGPLRQDSAFQEALAGLRPKLDFDGMLARAIRNRPVVLGYYFTDNQEGRGPHASGALPDPVFPRGSFAGRDIPFIRKSSYGANLPQLQAAAAGAGHFTPQIDPDGICRRIPALIEYQGQYYESLSLAMVRTLLWNTPLQPGFPDQAGGNYRRLEWLGIADLRLPVDERVCSLVPYRGPPGSFIYLSATDVMHDRVDADQLEGAIVLVGTTAPGLMDQRATPVAAVYPGVEIHANMIAGILDQTILHRPAWVRGAELVTLILCGLLLTLALPLLGPWSSIMLCLTVLAGVTGGVMVAWNHHLVLPLASSLLLIVTLYIWNASYGFLVETRAKRRITGLFGQYVPPALAEEMSRNPKAFTTEGESREMTVLFSDIRGFTSISEGLAPRELSRMMNEYMTPMTRVIHKHRGTIDKYIGDAIMAFWGAPMQDADHARNGVLTALEMQNTLGRLQPRFIERGWPAIRIGIGLNTGVMNVGNMGSEFRMAYTVLGDAVNLGSRLEGITKQYGVGIIVSETTRAAVPDIVFRELDRVRVKGKERPVSIYEPLGPADALDPPILEEVAVFAELLTHYRAMAWNEAEKLLDRLQAGAPDSMLYQLYRERINYVRANPPDEGWDGVFRFHTK
ncbi:MAG: adenylate/guanylate cyclase domain-containing protein [Desulfobacterales bacterium]|nr:adenylate/guanylate cyclase domain-containing protein [Desulfobacterales bacterium]